MGIKAASEIRSGNAIIAGTDPAIVIKTQLNKSGRNAAVVKIRMKNLLTGRTSEAVYRADDKIEQFVLEKKDCTYSYFSEPFHVFVDAEFNQYEIDAESLADLEKYLVADMTDVCEVTFYEGRPIGVELPQTIIREIEYTEPAARGDTSGKVMKSAILKGSKHELQVSAFVEIGDKVEIDTVSGEFKRRCT
jgi:elongation factor P